MSNQLKVLHMADLHYCPKHLASVHPACMAAADYAIDHDFDLAVIAGDSFDASMGIHEPAYNAYLDMIQRIANRMPLVILQGTYSHDRLGALDAIRTIGQMTDCGITVASKPERLLIYREENGRLSMDPGKAVEPASMENVAGIICALPSLNKADPDVMEQGAAQWVSNTLAKWSRPNIEARAAGIPTILVTHGTVTGCTTESNFAMVSPDHEFSVPTLASAECDAVMLGHIHRMQVWETWTPTNAPCRIAYSGSITRLVHGHEAQTGCIEWLVSGGEAAVATFIPLPSKSLVNIEYVGAPDMDELKEIAKTMTDIDYVRIRWNIDQEHSHTIDRDGIAALFDHCAEVKLEGTINPVQSIRSAGISRAPTMEGRLGLWAKTTGDEANVAPLTDRLEMLKSMDTDAIVSSYITLAR